MSSEIQSPSRAIPSPRIFEFDILRVLALFTILLGHSTSYVAPLPIVDVLYRPFTTAGLSTFFFLSGFGLQLSAQGGRDRQLRWWASLKRRLTRIYPLYLVAVAVYVILFHYLRIFHPANYSPVARMVIAHATSLQMFLFPKAATAMTIWFVGAIVPYYLLFTALRHKTDKLFLSLNVLAWSLLILIKVALEFAGVELIDTRIIDFFPLFLLGCWLARKRGWMDFFKRLRFILFPASFVAFMGMSEFMERMGYKDLTSRLIFSQTFGHLSAHFLNIIYCSLGVTFLIAASFVAGAWLKYRSPIILRLGALSYAAYLFHRIIYPAFYFPTSQWLGWAVSTEPP